jgi:hypothetical protein
MDVDLIGPDLDARDQGGEDGALACSAIRFAKGSPRRNKNNGK